MAAAEDSFIIKCRFTYKDDGEQRDDNRPNCETAYLHGSYYEKIFGKKLKDTDRRKRFIKITSKATKRSI